MQDGITINGDSISGTLAYVTDYIGFDSNPELQKGHFLALKWSEPQEGVTSLKVGVVPSSLGLDPVECISDTDRNGVFRITDPVNQRIHVIQSDGTHKNIQVFSLDKLVLAPSTGV